AACQGKKVRRRVTDSPTGASHWTTSRRMMQRQQGCVPEVGAGAGDGAGAVLAAATDFDAGGYAGGGLMGEAGGGGAGGRSRAAPARAGGVKMSPQRGQGVGWPAAASGTVTDW